MTKDMKMANTTGRKRAIRNMAMMAGAINRMGDGTYTCQIPWWNNRCRMGFDC